MTDIRIGDLVKATSKAHSENFAVFRAHHVSEAWIESKANAFKVAAHDFEVLDRPAPPIDEELIAGAKRAWLSTSNIGQQDWKAVINFVREYDKKNATKENA